MEKEEVNKEEVKKEDEHPITPHMTAKIETEPDDGSLATREVGMAAAVIARAANKRRTRRASSPRRTSTKKM